ncbi:MAG TPA: VCBS repeat-containing protein [Gemmataceae bacterium]|nr:VCBS repeat-containing protein [Gemmataceae bacterium]
MRWHCTILGVLALTAGVRAEDLGELQPPKPIRVAGKPLDVERDGHSAPFVGDIDGDGVRDLLVGQYHEGRLRIYRNLGSNTKPRFESYTWFEAGGKPGSVPVG